ncbi:MAG: quinone-dependent dihydroorotate dehydrogenase [Armatimonadetes bacterium]|nr:quinone-dependent dihydroorotate dehydrogenase [Armatimonadota bacterium]
MTFYEALIRKILFQLDPETAHNCGLWAIKSGIATGGTHVLRYDPVRLFGVEFPNRIGLAAGFDKDAVAVDRWHRFGFGFAEVGTLTPRPQPGNPKPRLFRYPVDKAIINRMGFNNHGAVAAAQRLRSAKPPVPIGINLGKNKDTPLESAAEDYVESFRILRGLGAYYVINVSSPNTPGLRQLQDSDSLAQILRAMRTEDGLAPILIKVAPDLEFEALDQVLQVALDGGAAGLIATNTTLSRTGLAQDPNQAGGLSGAPLRNRSDAVLEHLAKAAQGKLALIGVGGIFCADDVRRKLDLGADLVQLYTGWIYGGPSLVPRILRELKEDASLLPPA